LDILNSRAALKAPALFGGATGAVAAVFQRTPRTMGSVGDDQSDTGCGSLAGGLEKFRSVAMAWLFAVIVATNCSTAFAQTASDAAVQGQWFTGSLEAPSPSLSKSGALLLKSYAIYTNDTGSYDPSGDRRSSLDDTNQVATKIVLKYALTDRLTFQAIPSFAHAWNSQSSATGLTDLPVELEYRFNEENIHNGMPSVTASFGAGVPIGRFDRLSTSIGGFGTGAWTLKQGLLLQSLFDTPGDHPVRLRLYATAIEPLEDVSVQDASVYHSSSGFVGHARPGFASQYGLGGGYCLDQRWVLAIDVVRNNAKGFLLTGLDAAGDSQFARSLNSSNLVLASAVEYNWSGHLGVIAGVEYSAAGRNASSFYAPQVALSMSF
jgi:hypothetical protein